MARLLQIKVAEIDQELRVIWPLRERLAECRDRILRLALLHQCIAQKAVGRRVATILAQGLSAKPVQERPVRFGQCCLQAG